jgi:hypothetical protein
MFGSEEDWTGTLRPARGFVGLKRPGEDAGVLLAVLGGMAVEVGGMMAWSWGCCCGREWEGCCGSMVSVMRRWSWSENRHNEAHEHRGGEGGSLGVR